MENSQLFLNQAANFLKNDRDLNKSDSLQRIPAKEEILEFMNRIKDISSSEDGYFNSIVQNIIKVQEKHNENIVGLKDSIEKASNDFLDIKELIGIQIKMYQVTLSLDLTSKIASKVPNSVEFLMKG